jgi:hypothetical protein
MVAFFLLLLCALAIGSLDTPRIYNIYISTIIWFFLVLIAFVFMIFTFPNMWKYSFFLAAIYALSFFGTVFLLAYDEIIYKAVGVIALIASVGMCLIFMICIRTLREDLGGYKYGDEDKRPLLGFWFLGVILFLGVSIASIYMWIQWVKKNGLFLAYYIALEILIVLLFMYLLGYLEINFDWSRKEKYPVKKRGLASFIDTAIKTITETKSRRVSNSKSIFCPLCNSEFVLKKKKCPNCGGIETFKWCDKSEEFFIKCNSCGDITTYGRDTCLACDSKVGMLVACRHCGKEFELRDWE